ncbi:MAG: N-acetylmuramoyl-L-alanine amidase [Chitinophagaceae bacterium]|jgi:N-acetylmuramoyl-L-alanine amidase|nr:N-acetylmuramoyl-L-alanine amidase [Chitinophagaceae bacterium]
MRNIACIILFTCLCIVSAAQEKYRYLRTTGKLPMMAYGLGEDRLGGAKMNYIDTNILVKVVDSTATNYIIQLAKNRTAFLEKSYTKIDTALKLKPFYLTNSWSVKGVEDSFDIVSISMDERLPYKIWMETNPNKIMLELYGVQSNTNWITQLQNVKEVKNIYFNQIEDDVIQVTIDLTHQQHWGYTAAYKNKTLTIKVQHPPTSFSISNMVIAIDAGHGGTNTGASGITTKIREKEYTLLFAKALEKLLIKKGATVIMTRSSDTTIDNKDRVLFLQEQKPRLFISIHLNSSSKKEVQGVSTYYKHVGFRPLSVSILQKMLELDLNEFGNVGNFNFTPNAITDFPNCLVEVAFLSNEEDEKKILDSKFHKKVAEKIYSGIKDFLKENKD